MGLLLGLGAALSWGLADYFAAVASRRVGALQVVLGLHLIATCLLGAVVAGTGSLQGLRWSDALLFAAVGALGWASYLTFYRALAIGPISIVSPIVSGYAAVTVVLAVVVLGERLSAGETAAAGVVLLGVLFASVDLTRGSDPGAPARPLGIVLAVVTTILIGGFVFGVSVRAERLGWLLPVFLARAVATLLLLLTAARAGRPRLLGRSSGLAATVALLALLDTGGYLFFNVGVRTAATSVVATASAPYAVIPIVVGVLYLRERPTPSQWLGVALVLGGLVLLGLAA